MVMRQSTEVAACGTAWVCGVMRWPGGCVDSDASIDYGDETPQIFGECLDHIGSAAVVVMV